jgi:hypothetical protein
MALPTNSSSNSLFDHGFELREMESGVAGAQTEKGALVDEHASDPVSHSLPEGWKRLLTARRGRKLYEVSLPGRSVVYWEAEMILDGKRLQRRFASEPHARAWLAITKEPRRSAIPGDLEEIHGPIRIRERGARLWAGYSKGQRRILTAPLAKKSAFRNNTG